MSLEARVVFCRPCIWIAPKAVWIKRDGLHLRFFNPGFDEDMALGTRDSEKVKDLLFVDLALLLAEKIVVFQKFNNAADLGPFGGIVVAFAFASAHFGQIWKRKDVFMRKPYSGFLSTMEVVRILPTERQQLNVGIFCFLSENLGDVVHLKSAAPNNAADGTRSQRHFRHSSLVAARSLISIIFFRPR